LLSAYQRLRAESRYFLRSTGHSHTTRGRNHQNPDNTPTCNDLEIDNVDTRANLGSPFNPAAPFDVGNPANSVYNGPFALVVGNCDFEDSTGNAIFIFPTNSKVANDIFIHDTAVNYSAVTGILIDANNESDRKTCDSDTNPNWANDVTLFLPRNIRIDGTMNPDGTSTSTMNNNLTGAQGGSGRWLAFRNTAFNNNYINPQAFNFAGGTLEFDQCADTIQIYNNHMTGPTSGASNVLGALELRGRNIYVEGNTISGYPYSGVGAASVYNLTIGSNHITNNSVSTPTGGVQVETSFPNSPCDQIPRDTQTVTVGGAAGMNVITGQPFGVLLDDASILNTNVQSRNTINGLAITPDNNLGTGVGVGIAPIVVLNGYPSPPDPSPQPASGNAETPRALPIDPVSPATVKCSNKCLTCSMPGSDDEVFTFQGADLGGSANVLSIAGTFSVPGDDGTGVGGPGTIFNGTPMPVCYFLYYPAQNVVYLDGPDGKSNWAGGSSIVGTNGHDLTNYDKNSQLPANCIIHAGSTSSQFKKEKNIVDLTLDIQFLSGTSKSYNKHMYVFVENSSNQGSHGGTWLYWGYWVTP
jgi:hypothetical protein